jgi:hypothetical protein
MDMGGLKFYYRYTSIVLFTDLNQPESNGIHCRNVNTEGAQDLFMEEEFWAYTTASNF